MLVITGEGLKTLDAVRGTFETSTIEPRSQAFEAACAERGRGLMASSVKIPTQLRAAAGGEAEAQVDGATVQEVLDGAVRAATRSCACASPTSDGSLRRFVNVYLAGEDIRFLDGTGDARRRRRGADDPASGSGG